jgi:acetolactate synthase I/II/III large subunit
MMDPWQPMIPKTSSERLPDGRMVSKPIDDMFPFLPKEEYLENISK